jgi:hypothetical protein
MGLFDSIKNALTGPFRGIGKILSGDVKGALGAWGDTLKPVGMVLGATGVGAPIAIPMAAAGGAMQKLDDPNIGVGDVIAGGVTGGLSGAGASYVPQIPGLRGIGQGLLDFAQKNPQLALGVASAGADVYGAHKAGQAMDSQLQFQEESELRRMGLAEEAERERQRRQEMMMLLQAMVGSRPRY